MFIIYLVLGYWAAGAVCYSNKIVIHSPGAFFMRKLIIGFVFGWALIPIAILKLLFGRK